MVFEDVVVFGMVVFGVLIVGAGFFMRVFVSRLPRFDRSEAYAGAILLLYIGKGFWEGNLGETRKEDYSMFFRIEGRQSEWFGGPCQK